MLDSRLVPPGTPARLAERSTDAVLGFALTKETHGVELERQVERIDVLQHARSSASVRSTTSSGCSPTRAPRS